jgi:lauroyl/myristoyl acyltransferase
LDQKNTAQEARLICLLDHCDLYLSLLRRWRLRLPWHIECRGAWPTQGGFIATGFHHGTGHWIFSTFRSVGRKSTALYAKRDRNDYRGVPVRYWYGGLRVRDVEYVSGRKGVFRPHIRGLLDALKEGVAVTALADIPPRLAPQGQRPVRLLGEDVTMPEGLVKMAKSRNVPLVPFWTEFDLNRGTRTLVIGDPIDPTDVDATLRTLAQMLDARIRATPAAWMFWTEWPQWIKDSSAVLTPSQVPHAHEPTLAETLVDQAL